MEEEEGAEGTVEAQRRQSRSGTTAGARPASVAADFGGSVREDDALGVGAMASRQG